MCFPDASWSSLSEAERSRERSTRISSALHHVALCPSQHLAMPHVPRARTCTASQARSVHSRRGELALHAPQVLRGGWSGAEVVTRCKLDPITLTQARSGSLGTLSVMGATGAAAPGGAAAPPGPPRTAAAQKKRALGKKGLGKCALGLGKCALGWVSVIFSSFPPPASGPPPPSGPPVASGPPPPSATAPPSGFRGSG